MAYTQEQIAQYLRNAGFPESAIPTMLRIAQLASNNNANAFNPALNLVIGINPNICISTAATQNVSS